MAEGWDRGEGYLKTPFVVEAGYVDLPTGPGLGIALNEDVIKERRNQGDWDSPLIFHPDDGALAEW